MSPFGALAETTLSEREKRKGPEQQHGRICFVDPTSQGIRPRCDLSSDEAQSD